MTATESIAAAINQIDEKKMKLKKAFDELQTHRSLLSPSFNLSWSEIDSHFSSLQSSLSNRFRLLQSAATCSGDGIETSNKEVTNNWPELRTFCENMDGKGLGKFMISNSKKRLLINQELSSAIRCASNPAALVLDAIEGSYHCSPSSSSSSGRQQLDVRWIFVLLLEALTEIKANLTNVLRERARTLAYDWKKNIGNKPSEALGFLHLVAVFELGSLFNIEELVDYVFLISKYKQAPLICKKIGLDRKRTGNLIQKFLDTGRLLVAIRFIYEIEMTGEYQPVSILKTSLKNSREAAKRVCAQGNYSLQAQNEAADKELSALRGVITVVKEKKLESEFIQEKLEECVHKLEKQKAERRRGNKFGSPGNPQQQQVDKKRPRVADDETTDYIPMPRIPQQSFLPDPNCNLLVNPFGHLSSTTGPYGNPLYGFAQAPQPAHYGHQNGYGGFGMPAQYHPPNYPQ